MVYTFFVAIFLHDKIIRIFLHIFIFFVSPTGEQKLRFFISQILIDTKKYYVPTTPSKTYLPPKTVNHTDTTHADKWSHEVSTSEENDGICAFAIHESTISCRGKCDMKYKPTEVLIRNKMNSPNVY